MAVLFAPFLLASDLPIIVDLYFVGLRIDSLSAPSRYTSGLTVLLGLCFDGSYNYSRLFSRLTVLFRVFAR